MSESWTSERLLACLEELTDLYAPTAVPMREVFDLAKSAIAASLGVVEELLDNSAHLARVVAVSIMDFQARRRTTDEVRRRQLFELYLRRHDRIDSWDLVDRAAPHVIGRYLADRDRSPLFDLARSGNRWQRRTAITATYFFIRSGDVEDTFSIADILVDDPDEQVARAVGGWIREAGKHDPERLTAFLDSHAATMPRTSLRAAVEKLDAERRSRYLGLAARSVPRSVGRLRCDPDA